LTIAKLIFRRHEAFYPEQERDIYLRQGLRKNGVDLSAFGTADACLMDSLSPDLSPAPFGLASSIINSASQIRLKEVKAGDRQRAYIFRMQRYGNSLVCLWLQPTRRKKGEFQRLSLFKIHIMTSRERIQDSYDALFKNREHGIKPEEHEECEQSDGATLFAMTIV
jgi:hypothetical protein